MIRYSYDRFRDVFVFENDSGGRFTISASALEQALNYRDENTEEEESREVDAS